MQFVGEFERPSSACGYIDLVGFRWLEIPVDMSEMLSVRWSVVARTWPSYGYSGCCWTSAAVRGRCPYCETSGCLGLGADMLIASNAYKKWMDGIIGGACVMLNIVGLP